MTNHNYRFFTIVAGPNGNYTVKHRTEEDRDRYEEKLKAQFPYFRLVRSGAIFDTLKFMDCVNEQCEGYGFSAQCQTVQECGTCQHNKPTKDPNRMETLANA